MEPNTQQKYLIVEASLALQSNNLNQNVLREVTTALQHAKSGDINPADVRVLETVITQTEKK